MTTAIYFLALLLCLVVHSTDAKGLDATSIYFDLGDGLVEEFRGTYIFKYKKLEFIKEDSSNYLIKSSGDQSSTQDYLHTKSDYTYWTLSWSKENWFVLRNVPQKGDRWKNSLRGWQQTYEVIDTDVTLDTPAGKFVRCAKIKISWMAYEHDMKGLQEIMLYLAPHMAIIKQEHFENGFKWHEEVLTNFKQTAK
ncbi:MAG: hypothetical protein V1703_03135 [Candidatus Altiarchaeota archaeon]